MSTTRLGASDPRLADPAWMARTLERHGEMWIALEIGVSRTTVRPRIAQHALASQPPGRRRGVTQTVISPSAAPAGRDRGRPRRALPVEPTAILIVGRFTRESRTGGPAPSEDLLVQRIRAAHEARAAGDDPAYDDALLAIASAAGLLYEHRQKLRRSA